MNNFKEQGDEIRMRAKQLVLDFMNANSKCRASGPGLKQAEIFRECGFDWGNKKKATSSNQQYWIVALLRELEEGGDAEQLGPSGPWRLK